MGTDSVLGIVRTGRVETTLVAYQQTEGVLINSDQLDSNLCQHVELPVIVRSGGYVFG
jgi:hypothetical protein